MYNFIITFALATLISGCKLSDTENKKLELSSGNKTRYKIVLCSNPLPAETTASKELKKYLKKITGINFEIKPEKDINKETGNIYIGSCRYVKKNFPELDFNKIEPDRIIIKTVGGNLILAGGRPRGTLYAVFTFLEDTLGCRWWTSKASSIPVKKNISIPCLDIDYTPVFKDFRQIWYCDLNWNPEFCAKLKSHGFYQKIKFHPEWGGGLNIYPKPSHTYFRLLPPEKYFKPHPEWYSAEKNGKRYHKGGQLCENNPEMRKEIVKVCDKLLEEIKTSPKFIAIAAQDGPRGYCKCPECLETAKKEKAYSANTVKLANYISEQLKKKHDDFRILICPYLYVQKPPKSVKCDENIVIKFCTSDFSMLHTVNSEKNKNKFKYMKDWHKLNPGNKLWVQDYNAVFHDYLQPFPNYRIPAENIDIFVKNGVTGVYLQSDGHCPIGDFVKMRAWVNAHKLWNPDLKYDALEKEFLYGYYEEAAPYIEKYLRLMEKAAKKNKLAIHICMKSMNFLNTDTLVKGGKLFSKALKAVKEKPEIYKRVERDRIPLIYASIKLCLLKKANSEKVMKALGFKSIKQAVKELECLFKIWKPYKITERKAPNEWEELIELLKLSSVKPAKPSEIKPNTLWHDFQELGTVLYGASKIEKDVEASNKSTVKMPGNSNGWLLYYPINDDRIKYFNQYILKVNVKCDISNSLKDNEIVFSFGICSPDGTIKRYVRKKEIPDNQYNTYELSFNRELSTKEKSKGERTFIFVSPKGKDKNGKIKSIACDRAYLIKEK